MLENACQRKSVIKAPRVRFILGKAGLPNESSYVKIRPMSYIETGTAQL